MKCAIAALAVLCAAVRVEASVTRYANDYAGFVAAAGTLHAIDFETLPNGSPSAAGVTIDTIVNYDAQGAHFSASNGTLEIVGNQTSGFSLRATAPTQFQTTSLLATMISPVSAVGLWFGGHGTLSAFDPTNGLVGSVTYSSPWQKSVTPAKLYLTRGV